MWLELGGAGCVMVEVAASISRVCVCVCVFELLLRCQQSDRQIVQDGMPGRGSLF